MRICQIMLAKGFGGAERYFVDLSRAFAVAGHEVLAIHHPRFQARARLAGVEHLARAAVPVLGYWDPIARRRIEKIVRDFAPDVLQAHLARGAHIAGRVARALDLPLVVKLHNYVNLKYYRGVEVFVPTTADQAEYLRQQGVDLQHIRRIPNFSAFPPAPGPQSAQRAGAPVILSYGRMVRKKGFAELLEAARLLAAGGADFILLLGGDGPERERLQRRAHELGLDDRARFLGWLEDTRGALLNADLFVLPSLDEPFGIAVLEAMACGVPIVATRTRGPGEILDDETACLVAPGDARALAAGIGQILADRAQATARAARALARYRKQYSAEAVIPQFLDLYAGLIRKRTAGRRC
jgi:glycosyltransferase involved in cell wall biosynthesis